MLSDNFSCDAANPTGSVGISSSLGAVTPQFEWYIGVGTGGGQVGATAIVEDLADGIYTVKYIDGSTNCFVTDQVTIGDYTQRCLQVVLVIPLKHNVIQQMAQLRWFQQLVLSIMLTVPRKILMMVGLLETTRISGI